jgi:hypothetical protein
MPGTNRSRRKFLQHTALMGAALPLAAFQKLSPDRPAGHEEESPGPENKASDYTIAINGNTVQIAAGILSRSIDLAEDRIRTTSLRVDESELLSKPSDDFQLSFQQAMPDRRPAGLRLRPDQTTEWADAENASSKEQPVQWKELAAINGENCSGYFKLVAKKLHSPKKGVSRLHIRLRALENNNLKDVAINLYYEIYQGYPAIRKWIEIVNNGAQWLKLDQLVIDNVDIRPAFGLATPFTPEEKGAGTCIVSFSNPDRSSGIIAASEIPSALRKISTEGAMGYADEYFEWVIGPAERFVSEPVFYFAFHGQNIKTISGVSTALDRALEIPFKDFLRTAVGLRGLAAAVPAPIWCSYSNFLVTLTDADMRQQADIAARIGFVTFQLDEGWAKTPSPGGSEPGPGFPDFESTCAYIRSKGLQLGLWISCFRSTDSKDAAAIPDGRSLPLFTNTKRGYGMSFSSAWRDYFANDIVYMRDRYGMLYVKEDLTNISKGDIADSHESRTKKESLLRGLRGLLQVNRRVQEMAPDIWTQVTHEIYWKTPGPAADIAVLKYACAFHTNPNTYLGAGNASKRVSADWTFDPLKMRADLINSCWESRQRFYSHRGLPLYTVEFYAAHAVNIRGSLTTAVQDRQICSWLMGAPTVFAGDLSSLTEENIQHYRKRFDLLKKLQAAYNIYHYFQYSGVPAPTETDWHWWGKINEQGYGVVVVIRGSAGEITRAINIPWIITGKKYKVTALFSGKKAGSFSGAQLKNGAVKLALPVFGQEILELSPADA